MTQQIPLSITDEAGGKTDPYGLIEVRPDLACQRLALVNVAYIGHPGEDWFLVDAGIPGMAGRIRRTAAERFGPDRPPRAILLTHGHFDHIGCLEKLAAEWRVPVYAHPLEHPYLDGTASYPPPDPAIGGGLMSLLSPLFPRTPLDMRPWLRPFPDDGTIPGLSGWRWLHTPGHSVGHVSFWRESDHSLLAGDAFVTTAQESVYAVVMQAQEMHGPPMYFTHDWDSARDSVRRLATLEPDVAVTGHGRPMQGAGMRAALHRLGDEFDRVAHPRDSFYVAHPARAEDGSAYRTP